MAEIIKTTGNRVVMVYADKMKGYIDLEILFRTRHLATLVFEAGEAKKLLGELQKVIKKK